MFKGLQKAGGDLTTETYIRATSSATQDDFGTCHRVSFRDNHFVPEVVVRSEQVKGGRWMEVSPEIIAGQ